MHLVTFQQAGKTSLGCCTGEFIIDLRGAIQDNASRNRILIDTLDQGIPQSMIDLLNNDPLVLRVIEQLFESFKSELLTNPTAHLSKGFIIPKERVIFLPPIKNPGKIICVGLNYPGVNELEAEKAPDYPVLFMKPASALIGHGQDIIIPKVTDAIQYEGELVVVIGKQGKHIKPEKVIDHIAGYTIANDVGSYQLEQRSSQWTSGKISDTFCPLGPALVTSDKIKDPNNLIIRTTLNQKVVQEDNTSKMFYNINYLISYISGLTTLDIGDLILTGSPKRIKQMPDPRISMQPGDLISIEIEKLGKLTNYVIAEE